METSASPFDVVRKIGIWLGVIVLVVFVYLIFVARNLDAIGEVDALDYAQVARNVAEGEGYTTDFIKPLSLTRVQRVQDHPELIYQPAHIWVTSLFIRALGADKQAVALGSGVPFLLTLLVVYLFGKALFDTRVGVLGATLFGLNLWGLNLSISGYEVCLLGLWFTLLLVVLYYLGQKPEWRVGLTVLAGVLVGLLYLTKDLWGWTLIPVLVYVVRSVPREQRVKLVGLMLGALVIVILPWCVHVARETGNPLFSWRWYEMNMHTMTNPGSTLYRTYRPDVEGPLTFVFQHPREIIQKVRAGGEILYPMLALTGGFYAVSFFIVAILVPMGSASFERIRYVTYASFVLVCIGLVLLTPTPRMAFPLVPFVSLIAAALFFRVLTPLVRKYDPRRQVRLTGLAIAVLLVVHAFPFVANMIRLRHAAEQPAAVVAAGLCREVADLTRGAPIISDVPWFTAWYGNQPAIWTPREFDDLDRMQTDIGQVEFLLLTPVSQQLRATERTEPWANLWSAAMAGQPVAERGFVVARRLQNNWVLLRKVSMIPARPGEVGGGGAGG